MAIHSPNIFRGLALCAGVGGLELGLHVAEPEYKTVCFVEREAFPAAALVARMADKALDQAPIWDDLTNFDGQAWRGKVSVVTGGYPCQPFSQAGRRLGDKDPRHLWPHVKRIVREIGPEWCFFENVEGHLTLGANTVINDLQRMGYSVKAGLFSALECGASHIRRRLFIMAHADAFEFSHEDRICNGNSRVKDKGRSNEQRVAILNSDGGRVVDNDMASHESMRNEPDKPISIPLFTPPPSHFATWEEMLSKHPELQPCLFGLDNGVADRLERSAATGNGVVSLAAAYAWRTLKAAHIESIVV